MRRCLLPMVLVVVALAPRVAQAHYITGYAVGNHSACGATDLPKTIREVELLFSSPDLPASLVKNALWADGQVEVADWHAGGDRYESRYTTSGYDGADAPLISYISSHGVTRSGSYTAYAGGRSGCQIKSDDMAIGDQSVRYLILSTCKGLMIGNGVNPRSEGEDPRVTWHNANRGLNCIFGYSNNMADDDRYGANLMNLLATTDLTLAQAFFRASRLSSYDNIPAVMCFGPTEQAARAHLQNDRRFVAERYGRGASAFTYEVPGRLPDAFKAAASGSAMRRLTLAPRLPKLAEMSAKLVGTASNDSARPELTVMRSERGTLTVEHATGVVTWTRAAPAAADSIKLSDDEVIEIAAVEAARLELFAKGETWVPTYVIAQVASAGSSQIAVEKTVVFHQRLGALPALDTRGSLELRIDGAGDVAGFTLAAVKAWADDVRAELDTTAIDLRKAERIAMARLAQAHPEAKLTPAGARVGYATGAANAGKDAAEAVVEVSVDVERGGVGRRHVERIAL